MKNQSTTLPVGSTLPVSPLKEGLVPLTTQTLFPKGSRERTIIHENMEYRLRITAQGKLILTK